MISKVSAIGCKILDIKKNLKSYFQIGQKVKKIKNYIVVIKIENLNFRRRSFLSITNFDFFPKFQKNRSNNEGEDRCTRIFWLKCQLAINIGWG